MIFISNLILIFQQAPTDLRVGGGSAASSLHPAVMAFMLLALIMMAVLPRRFVVIPLLLFTFLTPFGEQIYVLGVHLFATRILILWGLTLAAFSKPSANEGRLPGGFTIIDKLFLTWAILRATATCLEFMNKASFINQCGFLWDAVGGYFLLRFLIRDLDVVRTAIKTFATITTILAITMMGEKLFRLNVFGYVGGHLTPFVRDGAIRSQGIFQGPIPAGTFAATLICLFVWLVWTDKSKLHALLGLAGALVMVVTSASSTPLLTCMASFLAVGMWFFRGQMRLVRWGIVAGLICLQMVMKAPVWYAIAHVDLVAGNSGYHRAILIDAFVHHFKEWWLIGVPSTDSWGWDLWDQANQFVAEGENGGLLTFLCFLWIICRCFGRLGDSRKLVAGDQPRELLIWLLGGALFSHVVAFFGLSYSDQIGFWWLALLSMITVTTASVLQPATEIETVRRPVLPARRLSPLGGAVPRS